MWPADCRAACAGGVALSVLLGGPGVAVSQPRAADASGPGGSTTDLRSIVLPALTPSPHTADDLAIQLRAFALTHPEVLSRLAAHEQLVAVRGGRILGLLDGTDRDVPLDATFDTPLYVRGADILLVHNHPHSRALSGADLGQLAKPGVAGIIAVGHDGSIYAAAASERYDANRFESITYPDVARDVVARIRLELPRARARDGQLDAHIEHVVATALAKAKIISYRALLSIARQRSMATFQSMFGMVSEGAAARLRRPGD